MKLFWSFGAFDILNVNKYVFQTDPATVGNLYRDFPSTQDRQAGALSIPLSGRDIRRRTNGLMYSPRHVRLDTANFQTPGKFSN